jgi:hypothetical protein
MSENSESSNSSWIAWALIASLVLGVGLGIWICENYYREEAVKRGYASWKVVDPAGNTKFEWNGKEPAK